MSVLSCNRYNCKNIMCDRYSHEYGYICNECFEELVNLGPQANIGAFMDSDKDKGTFDERASYEYFSQKFEFRN